LRVSLKGGLFQILKEDFFRGGLFPFYNKALLQNSPFRNPTDKKSLKNKDNFLKKSPNFLFRNSASIGKRGSANVERLGKKRR